MRNSQNSALSINRRQAIKLVGASALASVARFAKARAAPRPIKLGFVTPASGPLAAVGEVNDFVLGDARAAFKKGVANPAGNFPVEFSSKTASPTRTVQPKSRRPDPAGQRRTHARRRDAGKHQPGVRPVRAQRRTLSFQRRCLGSPGSSAAAAIPPKASSGRIISTGGSRTSSTSSRHLERDRHQQESRRLPRQRRGRQRLGRPQHRIAAAAEKRDTRSSTPAFPASCSRISAPHFRVQDQGVEIVSGVPIPPDFKNFWPRRASKASVRRSSRSARPTRCLPPSKLGDLGVGLSQEVWWTPTNPYKSSLTGVSSAGLAKAYEDATGRQYNGMIGFSHSLLEVAADMIKRAKDPTDKDSLVEAIVATDLADGGRTRELAKRADEERLQNSARIWPVGQGRETQIRDRSGRQQLAPEIPIARKPFAIAN